MRRGEPGPATELAGLPAEAVRLPGLAVIASLDRDFVAGRGHHPEEAVRVGAAQWANPRGQPVDGPRDLALRTNLADPFRGRHQHQQDGECHDERAARSQPVGMGGGRRMQDFSVTPPPPRQQCPRRSEVPVIEHRQAQDDRQDVETTVVAGREDQQLEEHQADEPHTAQDARAEHEERGDQLRVEHHADRRPVEPPGELVHVPARPGRQGLRQVVVVEGAPLDPRPVAVRELHDAREEHQPEDQPAEQPDGRHPRLVPGGAEAPGPGRQQQRQQARLEQQRVPLEAEELLPHDRQRQVRRPADGQARPRQKTGRQQDAAGHTDPADRVKHPVGRVDPEDRRDVPDDPGGDGSDSPVDDIEVARSGQNAARADQPVNLHDQRAERREVDQAQRAKEDRPHQAMRRSPGLGLVDLCVGIRLVHGCAGLAGCWAFRLLL